MGWMPPLGKDAESWVLCVDIRHITVYLKYRWILSYINHIKHVIFKLLITPPPPPMSPVNADPVAKQRAPPNEYQIIPGKQPTTALEEVSFWHPRSPHTFMGSCMF